MFRFLGHTVARTWPILLGIWVVVLVTFWWRAPAWRDVAQDLEFAFLPKSAPSRHSEEVFKKAFPQDEERSNIVLVLERGDQQTGPPDAEKKFVEDTLEPELRKIAKEEGGLASQAMADDSDIIFDKDEPPKPASTEKQPLIAQIQTPNALGRGALLVSEDKRALLVVVGLTNEYRSRENWPIVVKIEDLIRQLEADGKLPQGDKIYLTGSAVIGRDHTLAEAEGARAIGIWTMILVIILLILIYRAPLLALIPLVTVYLATQMSLHALSLTAQHGYVTLFAGLEVFIAVLSYGAGIDYYLLLTARYKEELDRGAGFHEAVARAVEKTGAAVTASAGTVMGGIGMMAFAEFGKFYEAGLAIPMALGIVLLATFTFSASLLMVSGRWAFYPHFRTFKSDTPSATVAKPEKDGASLLPDEFSRFWRRVAWLLLHRPGTAWVVSVCALLPFAVGGSALYHYVTFDPVGDLPPSTLSVAGTRALQSHFPAGLMGPVTVLVVDKDMDFTTTKGHELVSQFVDRLQDRRDELGLTDIRSLVAPLGISEVAKNAFEGTNLRKEAVEHALAEQGLEHYATDFGERKKTGTRLDLILTGSPFSTANIGNLNKVEEITKASLPQELAGSELYFVGPTASLRDLKAVVSRDRTRIEILVLLVVFLILVVLLRRILVSLYLIMSVLLSYYATLGVTFVVFWLIDRQHFTGIDWKVTIFLFTILIAVGEDYNIFLMARIDEEQKHHGAVKGIIEALIRTGSVISSAGIIMAGTFASLLAGTLTEMKQLGFALSFGVLLDTFLVRPVLVPSFLIVLHRRRYPTHNPKADGPPAKRVQESV
jgi:RND superfamily putative drug exporter